jgi:hypothetical protein
MIGLASRKVELLDELHGKVLRQRAPSENESEGGEGTKDERHNGAFVWHGSKESDRLATPESTLESLTPELFLLGGEILPLI